MRVRRAAFSVTSAVSALLIHGIVGCSAMAAAVDDQSPATEVVGTTPMAALEGMP